MDMHGKDLGAAGVGGASAHPPVLACRSGHEPQSQRELHVHANDLVISRPGTSEQDGWSQVEQVRPVNRVGLLPTSLLVEVHPAGVLVADIKGAK